MNETIKVIDIEKELNKLWEERTSPNQMKASLFNLIIYTETEERKQVMENIVEKIIENFPSRLLFIDANPNSSSSYLEVKVGGEAKEKGTFSFICDQIFIHVGGKAMERVPSLILPHLAPDLPTFCLYGEDITKESPSLKNLESLTNRFIFDSAASFDFPLFLQKIVNQVEAFSKEFMDLNWARIACWRQVLRQVFDSSEKLKFLYEASQIRIGFSPSEKNELSTLTQSIFLQGWLACRLGWEYISIKKEDDSLIITYRVKDKPLSVSLFPEEKRKVSSGTILSFHFGNDSFFSSLERVKDSPLVKFNMSTKEKCDLPFMIPLPSLFQGKAFIREVFYNATTEHYRHMIKEIQKIPFDKLSDKKLK